MIGHAVALAAATLLLVAVPGPNVATIVATSIRHGARLGMVTVAGTTLGVALQLLLVVAGLATLVGVAADALAWIRWAGVAYLIVLGVRTWTSWADDLDAVEARAGRPSRLALRGAILAVVNPKTLIFNAAFLPQFVDPSGNPASQLALLAAVFVAVLAAGDCAWALAAGSARSALQKYGRLRNRITGGLLVASGVGLAAARR